MKNLTRKQKGGLYIVLSIIIFGLPYLWVAFSNSKSSSISALIFQLLLFTASFMFIKGLVKIFFKEKSLQVTKEESIKKTKKSNIFFLVSGIIFIVMVYFSNSYYQIHGGYIEVIIVPLFFGLIGLTLLIVWLISLLRKPNA